jgi:mannose-6-phosphate isomerase-like protein (cupin superfamily)
VTNLSQVALKVPPSDNQLRGNERDSSIHELRAREENLMTESTAAFPYETRVNILHGPLELIDVKALADACEFKWFNQTLCQVNGSVVRLGVFEGEYHWHKHDDDDEFFYVVEGLLLVDLEERVVEVAQRLGFVVPRGVLHRTRALQRAVVLMVENAGIIPTGN